MRGTWQTTDSGSGGGLGTVILVIAAVLLTPAAGAVVGGVVEAVVITVGVLVAVTATVAGVVVWRHRRARRGRQLVVRETTAPWQVRATAQRPVIEQHVHHHWNVTVTPEQADAILRNQQDEGR